MTMEFEAASRFAKSGLAAGAACCWWALQVHPAAAGTIGSDAAVEELRSLSLEELSQIEVTSVAKRPQPLSQAPSAVYVINSADIRRSGAVTLPEVLRLAPNLQVSRVDGRDYAISARGLNSFETANKLLVMIDGRSVYTPLYSGVEWDGQHIQLEDVERIEVISGPGGALWGANAVNGVINMISRSARDTQGLLATANLGSIDQRASVRYGGSLGEAGAYRVFLAGFGSGPTRTAAGSDANDKFQGVQGGFRADFDAGANAFTVQGDAFDAPMDDLIIANERLRGANLLGRWRRQLSTGGAAEIQAYYDQENRVTRGVFETTETWDVEGRYTRAIGRHQFVLGGGYRSSHDNFANRLNAAVLDPPMATVTVSNLFAQDDIALTTDLTLTAGIKLEDSSFSGSEWLPSARLAWQMSERDMVWAAVSRAVRSPSRIDRELVFPGLLVKSRFEPETLIAYEAGYRGRPASWASVSVSVFYNHYDRIRTNASTPVTFLPIMLANGIEGETWGLEAWGDIDVAPWWRLGGGIALLDKRFRIKAGQTDISNLKATGDDPAYQVLLHSQMAITPRLDLSLNLRAVDELERSKTPGYVEAGARLAWRASDSIELAMGGQNLLHESHRESAEPRTTETPRNLYAEVRWSY